MEQKLKGKIALVTGSSSGIGRAVAVLFAKQGADVIVTSYKNKEGGEQTIDELRSVSNGKHLHINCDLGKQANVKKAFAQIEKEYGRIDILVNNAGIASVQGAFDDLSENELTDLYDSNVKSMFWCSQLARGLMGENGWIINTSSFRGLDYAGRSIAYASTKAAINSFTKTLALEFAPKIFVNAVLPGFVYTANYDTRTPEQNMKYIDSTPIKRFITCDEIAEAYLFLSTQKYLTGTLLVADGGASILGR